MPQKPRFLRKMMGFDGGGLVLTSATLRCTSKPHSDNAVGFCCMCAVGSNSYVTRKPSNRKEHCVAMRRNSDCSHMRNRVRLGVRVVACATLRLERSSSYGAKKSPRNACRGLLVYNEGYKNFTRSRPVTFSGILSVTTKSYSSSPARR